MFYLLFLCHTDGRVILSYKTTKISGKHNGNTRIWHSDLPEMDWHQQKASIVTLMWTLPQIVKIQNGTKCNTKTQVPVGKHNNRQHACPHHEVATDVKQMPIRPIIIIIIILLLLLYYYYYIIILLLMQLSCAVTHKKCNMHCPKLAYWGRGKMNAIIQTTLSNAFF